MKPYRERRLDLEFAALAERASRLSSNRLRKYLSLVRKATDLAESG